MLSFEIPTDTANDSTKEGRKNYFTDYNYNIFDFVLLWKKGKKLKLVRCDELACLNEEELENVLLFVVLLLRVAIPFY